MEIFIFQQIMSLQESKDFPDLDALEAVGRFGSQRRTGSEFRGPKTREQRLANFEVEPDADDENQNAPRAVDNVGQNPNFFRTANKPGQKFQQPSAAHQDEQLPVQNSTENHNFI